MRELVIELSNILSRNISRKHILVKILNINIWDTIIINSIGLQYLIIIYRIFNFPLKEDGNLSRGTKLPSGLASMFIELAGANLAWG